MSKFEEQNDQSPPTISEILLNIFQIKNKRYHFLLDDEKIIYEKEKSKCAAINISLSRDSVSEMAGAAAAPHNTTFPSQDVIPEAKGIIFISDILGVEKTTTPATASYSNLKIHYAQRIIKSSKDCNRWRHRSLHMKNHSNIIIDEWYHGIEKRIQMYRRINEILVFINPYGGNKKGVQNYEKYCRPLFELANIKTNCIKSERFNHIFDMLMTIDDIERYDGICCVGGDGTVAEVINGLIFRTMKDLNIDNKNPQYIPKPKIPIAIIPSGSTDTVAYSLHGTSDVRTAAIHLVLGLKKGLDICSVSNQNGLLRFCASVLSYGYLGDVAFESEKCRWMGTKRYEYAGFKAFMSNCGYGAELRIYEDPYDGLVSLSTSLYDTTTETNSNEQKSESHDNEYKCFANCNRCMVSETDALSLQDGVTQYAKHETSIPENSKSMQETTSIRKYEYRNDQAMDDAMQENWKTIEGMFFMISGANINCACSRSPNGIAKYCHLGDGYIDLVLVRKTSFINNMKLICNMIRTHGEIKKLPFVEVHRTKKFWFRALPYPNETEEINLSSSCEPITRPTTTNSIKTSQWNCDGEVVFDLNIIMSSHCQLIDVFMRGPLPFTDSCAAGIDGFSCAKICTT